MRRSWKNEKKIAYRKILAVPIYICIYLHLYLYQSVSSYLPVYLSIGKFVYKYLPTYLSTCIYVFINICWIISTYLWIFMLRLQIHTLLKIYIHAGIFCKNNHLQHCFSNQPIGSEMPYLPSPPPPLYASPNSLSHAPYLGLPSAPQHPQGNHSKNCWGAAPPLASVPSRSMAPFT